MNEPATGTPSQQCPFGSFLVAVMFVLILLEVGSGCGDRSKPKVRVPELDAPILGEVQPKEITAPEGKLAPLNLVWSKGSRTSAHFYFHHPSGDTSKVWRYAPSRRRELIELTQNDIRCDFFGPGDPNGPGAFGKNWGQRALMVTNGQVVLARLSSEADTIYALKVQLMDIATLRVSYATVPAADVLQNGKK